MDLKDAEKQIDRADSFLDKLWKFLGKHWGKLLIITLIYGCYKFAVLVSEEMDKPQEEQVQPVEYVPANPTITEQYYLLYDNGDSSLVRTWSDGIIDTVAINY